MEDKEKHWEFKDAISFFIFNLPREWNWKEVRSELKKLGIVVDVYLSHQRDKHGYRFRFFRFERVTGEKKLEENLNKVCVGGLRIFAKVAKFSRQGNEGLMAPRNGIVDRGISQVFKSDSGFRKENVSFAEVVKGVKKSKGWEQEKEEPITKIENTGEPKMLDAHKEKRKVINLVEEQGWSMRLSDKLVGEVKSFSSLACISNLCICEGLRNDIAKYLGGSWVMFDTINNEEEQKILSSKELGAHFISVMKWDEKIELKDRFAWLKIEGIPVQARNPNSFISIGKIWGKWWYLIRVNRRIRIGPMELFALKLQSQISL